MFRNRFRRVERNAARRRAAADHATQLTLFDEDSRATVRLECTRRSEIFSYVAVRPASSGASMIEY